MYPEQHGFSESFIENQGTASISEIVNSLPYYSPNFTSGAVKTLPIEGIAENSVRKLQGIITPEYSGVYRFWLAGEDSAILSISEDDSKFKRKEIAHLTLPTIDVTSLGTYREQLSELVTLEAGKKYYIQIDHQTGSGDNSINLMWSAASKPLTNWARQGASASQSSTSVKGVPARAIDGNTSGDWNSGSITHTNGSKSGAWWRVDLKADRVIDRIELYNRNLNGFSLRKRLSNFRVTVEDQAGNITFTKDFHTSGSYVDAVEYIETSGVTGRFVKVQSLGKNSNNDNILSLAEVKVLGRSDSDDHYYPISSIESLSPKPFYEDGQDVDADDLIDTWEEKYGFDPTKAELDDYASYADPDKDGLSNIEESGRDSDPFVGETFPQKLTMEKWQDQLHFNVSDFVQSSHYFEKSDLSGLVDTTSYRNINQYQFIRLRGYITAPESGYYHFWVSGTTGAEFWLSSDETKYRKQRIAALGGEFGSGTAGVFAVGSGRFDQYASQASEKVYLEAGEKYFMEMLSQQHHAVNRHITVAWARPNAPRELLPIEFVSSYGYEVADSDDDYLPDAWEEEYGLSSTTNGKYDPAREGEYGDFDNDGLTNREEFVAGTNPANSDSDGDGYDDFYEIVQAGSNPNEVDLLAVTEVADVDLQTYSSDALVWSESGGVLTANGFRGDVSWDFNAPTEGHWVLNIETRLEGSIQVGEEVKIFAYLDGVLLEEVDLKYSAAGKGTLRLITPQISSGTHSLKLFIDNTVAYRRVAIESFTVNLPVGLDADDDGTVDWIKDELEELNFVKPYATSSVVSPAFIEGSARNQALVNGELTEVGTDSKLWYTNIELAQVGDTSFEVEFEEGVNAVGHMTWVNTNIMTNPNLVIRKGDSLKLVAIPTVGVYGGAVTYTIGNNVYEVADASESYIFTFESEGEHLVIAQLANGEVGTLTVDVKQAEFVNETVDFVSNTAGVLSFKNELVDHQLLFDGGSSIVVTDQTFPNATTFNLNVLPTGQGSKKLAARLYEDGPIVGVKDINIIKLSDALQNDSTASFNPLDFPNYRLVVSPIVLTNLPEGGYIKVRIYRSGVTFLDGSTKLAISTADFVNGSYNLQFLFNKNLTGGYCHYIDIYDRNGKLVASR